MINEFVIIVTLLNCSDFNGLNIVKKYTYKNYSIAQLKLQEELENHELFYCSDKNVDFQDLSHKDEVKSESQDMSDEEIKNKKIEELDQNKSTNPDSDQERVE